MKTEKLRNQIRRQTVGYMLAAFGLVAGLAWNEAIKSLIDYLIPLSKNTLFAKFLYALIITMAVVLISNYLLKMTKEKENDIS